MKRRSHTTRIPWLGILIIIIITFYAGGFLYIKDSLMTINNKTQSKNLEEKKLRFNPASPNVYEKENPFISIMPVNEEEQHRNKNQKQECWDDRDFGLVENLKRHGKVICKNDDEKAHTASQLKHFRLKRAQITSSLFSNLEIDFRDIRVHKQIERIAQDGSNHDPRFVYKKGMFRCTCIPLSNVQGPRSVWNLILTRYPAKNRFYCQAPLDRNSATLSFSTNVIAIARRDDHNPFFQVSNALNAWIMMQAVGWNVNTTQLVYLDDGFPSATDVLQERILSPNFPVIKGKELMGNIVHFENIFLTPFENTGPMMRHLNDDEPCQRNKMLLEFRKKSFEVMNVKDKKTSPESCLVTVITRRPYEGRRVQRIWLNEDEVLDQMRKDYAKCTFQSIDFVDLSLEKQMTLMKDSDMVISMHGAGLVNLFWTREGTHVIEIFPKKRFRWGYRNLCQFIGCEWNEFRGGNDTGVGDNASDKTIPYEEWKPFFDPIFTKMMGQKLQ